MGRVGPGPVTRGAICGGQGDGTEPLISLEIRSGSVCRIVPEGSLGYTNADWVKESSYVLSNYRLILLSSRRVRAASRDLNVGARRDIGFDSHQNARSLPRLCT